MICGSGGSKSRLAKAAGAEPAGQTRDEKLDAAVTRSTFRSQNVQNTPFSDHFWKLRCRKSARRCGAKDISKPRASFVPDYLVRGSFQHLYLKIPWPQMSVKNREFSDLPKKSSSASALPYFAMPSAPAATD